MYAQGVCDPTRPCNTELSFNATEIENVAVAAGETKVFDPMAQRGQRHFRTEIVANEMIILGPRDKVNSKPDFNEDELPLDLVDQLDVEERNTY